MLKKNSLRLEKDAFDDNTYYIIFDFISTAKFNIRIFFNACENNTTSKAKKSEEETRGNNSPTRVNRQIELLKDELVIKEDWNNPENENYLNSNFNKANFKKYE